MAQHPITLGDLERNPELLYQFIAENTRSMIQYCVREFEKINEADAEYLFENTFLKLTEIIIERQVQKKDAPARAWMYKELKWRCRDFVRSKEGNVVSGEEGENIIDIFPDPTSIEDEITQREIAQFLRECIQKRMKGRRREIFALYSKGYIAAEIARKLDMYPSFVSRETKIGNLLLVQWLTERGFDADSIRYLPFVDEILYDET